MSPRAACRLESLGFTPIYDYVAGLADWTANGLPMEGRLASVLRAGDVVRRDTPTCRVTERLGDAQERAKSAGQNVCIVTTESGIVLGRIRGEALAGDADISVELAMEAGPTTIRPDTPLKEYMEHMRAMRVGSILVTASTGRLIGVLYRQDAEDKFGSSPTT